MPHGNIQEPTKSKLNPHGDTITHGNKFQKGNNEYYPLNADPTIVQIQTGLEDSNLTSLATQQLSQNNLWFPENEYDIFSENQTYLDRPPGLSQVASQIGLGSLVNFQNSVLGRFLGLAPKTPMIEIANSRLILEFSRRVTGSLTSNLLPTLNIGGFLLGKIGLGPNQPLIRPAQEYKITKLSLGEKVRDTAYYVDLFTGFESNKDLIGDVKDNKGLINRTGSGQITLLKQNLEQNLFRPSDLGDGVGGFLTKIINKINKFLSPKYREKEKEETLKFDYNVDNYKGTDIRGDGTPLAGEFDGLGKSLPPQQDLSNALRFPTEQEVDKIFTDSPEVQGWKIGGDEEKLKRGLLRFTQTIINSGHAVGQRINQDNYGWLNKDGNIISKGRNLIKDGTKPLSSKNDDGRSNVFCRSWIKTDQYDQYKKAIRHEKHYLKHDGNLSNLNNFSVLNNIGMPRIHPVSLNNRKENFKPMMFSLENLAWDSEDILALPQCERGPNDGRIMWFPPYEIQIDENIGAHWEKTDFIGRGEPIYTYNNSERTLNFQFKLIMDYPSNLRANIDNVRKDADKFFAGCGERSKGSNEPMSQDALNNLEIKKEELSKLLEQPETKVQIENYTGPGKSESNAIKFYFLNDKSTFDSSYEANGGQLNEKTISNATELTNFIKNNKDARYHDLNLEGHASKSGTEEANKTLSLSRIDSIKSELEKLLGKEFKEKELEDSNINKIIKTPKGEKEAKDEENSDKDSTKSKESRFVKVWIEPNFDSHPETKSNTLDPVEKEKHTKELDDIEKQLNEQRAENFIGGECLYFKELKETDPFIFKEYEKKIDYFHPSFHSQTPDDFNKRLVFLHQCTRQGKPFLDEAGKNSVFGRMPVCVLRIGDFFNCRIIINNIGFSYEPLIWDLNPEGSGVQPMLCNVNVNCNIIGGASLEGPITELQNALSSKFYANHKETTRRELEEFMITKLINLENLSREAAIKQLGKELSVIKV